MNATSDEPFEQMAEVGPLSALVLPRISAVISLVAVVCVFVESGHELRLISRRDKSKTVLPSRGRVRSPTAVKNMATVHTIQFFYQIPLFCFSFANALGSWPAPSEYEIWGAFGNNTTCAIVGALNQFGILGSLGWDAALSLTYLGMARGWTPARSRYLHLLIWPLALVVTLTPVIASQEIYNFHYSACWISEYPDECKGEDCQTGATAPIWMAGISFLTVLHLVYSTFVMAFLYCWSRQLEDRQQGSTSRQYSRPILIQGCLYACGMVSTLAPTSVNVALYQIAEVWSPGLVIFASSLTPLVGWVNFLVYMRNKQPQDCHTAYGRCLRQAHGWLLDYDLVCNCQCWRGCGRRKRRFPAGEEGGTTATNTNASTGASSDQQSDSSSSNPELPPNAEVAAADGSAKGGTLLTAATSTTTGDGTSTWSGFLVAVRRRGPEQYVSDLSGCFDDHDDGCKNHPQTSIPVTESNLESNNLNPPSNKDGSMKRPPPPSTTMPCRSRRILSNLETHAEESNEKEQEDEFQISGQHTGLSLPASTKTGPQGILAASPVGRAELVDDSNNDHTFSSNNGEGDQIECLHRLAQDILAGAKTAKKKTNNAKQETPETRKPPPSHVAVESEFSNVSSIYTMPEMYHNRNLYPKLDNL